MRYPDRITLIRGNHESRQITQVHNYIKYSIPFNQTMKVEYLILMPPIHYSAYALGFIRDDPERALRW